MATREKSIGDEAVEKVEADRPGIGLSDKDAEAESGDPNVPGGEPTRAVEPRPQEPPASEPEPPVEGEA